ncbi:cilia- and flagella-associated protein 45-like isoform X2 [Tyto alba]|uniref:cilia- and flagella-associated protein 45-like isoform X2 n=1 Tax=Tyto alba TaxID=56313 RepID=UPI001C682B58|nr:cilia- and flagella-associated protein 45-like isoform X2 [Tyto alba]
MPARSQSRCRRRRRARSAAADEMVLREGQSLQPSCSNSPVVILRDVQTAPKASPTGEHKPKTTRLITKDLIRDLVRVGPSQLERFLHCLWVTPGGGAAPAAPGVGSPGRSAGIEGAVGDSVPLTALSLCPAPRTTSIPAENPAASLIIGREDFQRIKEAARVLTKEEREAKLAALKAETEAVLEAVSERKNLAKQKAIRQQQVGKLSELEEAAQERAQYLLQRASRMRMEQEDEIKEFSELVLGAKCHMIRDTQILEKQLIAKELEEEEKRLANMMEVERKKANEMQEELERRRKQELIRGRQELVKQMEQNAEERALRAVQRDQEAQEVLEYLERLKMEDLKDLERRQEQQKKIQAEIKRINDENQRLKEEQREQERMADERVLEYQRQKMKREAEFEAEQERIRWEKEKETARLRAMQERAQDHQAEQDALRAKRSQEAAEREWRRKEKEAAQKKAEMEQMLKQSRLEQIAQREHSMAVQAQQDRHEFERILRAQQEKMEKEKVEEAQRAGLRLAHANDVRCQMRERQQQLAQERVAAFEECQRLEEEARQRSQRITQLKQQKMQELRAAGIPEKYCAQVERKALSLTSAAPGQAQPHEEQSSSFPVT